jgi:gamma-glutamylaminecyclotransferase
MRVFVYGTLMRGECNHHWMYGARFLGKARSVPQFSLWSLGAYPVLCTGGHGRIHGEVYRVGKKKLQQLDLLEECPRYYRRGRLTTRFGLAWFYYQSVPPAGSCPLPAGNWRRRGSRPLRRDGFDGVSACQSHLDLA